MRRVFGSGSAGYVPLASQNPHPRRVARMFRGGGGGGGCVWAVKMQSCRGGGNARACYISRVFVVEKERKRM